MHADPHGGNLLRVAGETGEGRWRRLWARPPRARLAYLDFGLVSNVPLQVREGLVCAVAYLLFARDVSSVAGLFGELMLLPPSELESPERRRALEEALEQLAASVLVEPSAEETAEGGRSLPTLAFDQLITQLALLAPRFAFELPPYFLNNARAIATLEGMARSADPSFDVLQVVYPFALRRLLADPRASPVLGRTLTDLTRGEDGRLDLDRAARLLDEASALSKLPRRKLLLDAARTKGGRAFGRRVGRAAVARVARRAWGAVRGSASVAA